MKLQLNKTYLIFTILLFTIEVLIALYVTHGFIRYTFGDYLVVILLYCFFKSFTNTTSIIVAIIVLIIAYTIELLQLINMLELLNLNDNYVLKLVFGSTFQVSDLVAYSLGVITVLIIEYSLNIPSLKN
ncbi:ribosomal maturation YjgA family protein [Flavivirga eckloniae]|uniref:DUF2809 domain-containing protein n=1 Tax=Flavivirga eckloniae TaxID=1803846 RepID=A0A2K9PMM1_9FLAO|nr:DUF2809 domain-containing protein [Flavivirga eckloniae]AUP78311.1 DUF2809 domain-containing protein [Flavivirga eckloniae]